MESSFICQVQASKASYCHKSEHPGNPRTPPINSRYHATIMHTILTFFILTTSQPREIQTKINRLVPFFKLHPGNYVPRTPPIHAIMQPIMHPLCNHYATIMHPLCNHYATIMQPLCNHHAPYHATVSPATYATIMQQSVPRHTRPSCNSQSRDMHPIMHTICTLSCNHLHPIMQPSAPYHAHHSNFFHSYNISFERNSSQ